MESKNNFLNIALIFLAVFITSFTITMIVIFCIYQSVPDQLISSVFAACTGETSATAIIFSVKKIMDGKSKRTRAGDITGFDDAELVDDIPDQIPEVEESE